jgi:8-oxo-dGTP pyrophosphatase MutT (NUDIX family)
VNFGLHRIGTSAGHYDRRVRAGRFHQQIPRPLSAAPGADPPWSTLSVRTRANIGFAAIRRAVSGQETYRHLEVRAVAAVLLAVVDLAGEPAIILTRRALDLDRDPGLIAFPGGYIEEGETPEEAALREAEEEIGLARGLVEVVGSLGPVVRHRDGLAVASFVGIVSGQPRYAPSAKEVDAIFEIPLSALLAEGAAWEEQWERPDLGTRAVRFFELGDDVVWGLSAQLLWRFLAAVTATLAGDPEHPGSAVP